ncbi:MAG: flagellar hook-basal body complex protein [Arcobacteraceae bacterium]|nr:flagellar hook-basal body complex protein [Arcobacteraceae bacterium]
MNPGIYPLAASMVNQLNRVDTLSNNLANSNTVGFKQDNLSEGSFNYYLERSKNQNIETTKFNVVTNTVPKIDGKFVDKNLGAITPTNNQLDFAIKDEEMFFKVQNPKTGEILLTRDGAFGVLNEQLVTKNGFYVLNNDNGPIIAQDEFAQQIAVVKTQFENLDKQGNNNYRIKLQQEVEALVGNEGFVLQGALERSNVNSVTTMVSLIESHRRFEQAQKAMTGIDELNKSVIEKVGRAT